LVDIIFYSMTIEIKKTLWAFSADSLVAFNGVSFT